MLQVPSVIKWTVPLAPHPSLSETNEKLSCWAQSWTSRRDCSSSFVFQLSDGRRNSDTPQSSLPTSRAGTDVADEHPAGPCAHKITDSLSCACMLARPGLLHLEGSWSRFLPALQQEAEPKIQKLHPKDHTTAWYASGIACWGVFQGEADLLGIEATSARAAQH